jgi:hypothetical protein
MKVFLSWSGPTSRQVAEALRRWLPFMIQSIEPFISSGDISKGDTWSDVLAHELQGAEYGIVCVTPYNVTRPWMIFEAGAMSHYVGRSSVTPLLFQVSPEALDGGPLAQFQTTELTRDDFFRLIGSINRATKAERHLDEELLERNFDHWWQCLQKDLAELVKSGNSPAETRTSYSWLRTTDDLPIDDLPPASEVVWIITSDVFKYVIGNGARQRIERNLDPSRAVHVTYRFLFKQDSQFTENEKDLLALKAKYASSFDYRTIDPAKFEELAPTDYVMLQSRDLSTLQVFVRAPIADKTAEYWFEAEPRAATAFFRRFTNLFGDVPK